MQFRSTVITNSGVTRRALTGGTPRARAARSRDVRNIPRCISLTTTHWPRSNAVASGSLTRRSSNMRSEEDSIEYDSAWGDELRPGGKFMANTFQDHFPDQNNGEDGYINTVSGWFVSSERIWIIRHVRQCLGVDLRLVPARLLQDWRLRRQRRCESERASRKFRSLRARRTKEGSTRWFLLVYGSILRPLICRVGGGKGILTRAPITLASAACSIRNYDAAI
jgi:hypothetical protein